MSISTSIAAAESSLRTIASTVPIPTSSPTATSNRTNGACSAVMALGMFRNASDLQDPKCSDYYGDDDEKRSVRRQTLCTDNRDDTLNDEGTYSLSFELRRTNELIKVLSPELRTHTQASSWL
ncbi:hypothetical protein SNOG_14050 [Parastagonospora nodorum SN15]|uniref:Uncharacterized protein n=1 Tax=Phaeosphaeria nodorum (strain SN15 / ATCC MYA-4574 / FGSC 10173) TaxID=321614 RepID=Q0U2I3_PHANO|nr:hypothetical protein SNOG_14050 [Parastagonospora nodorum SN15]EAT78675.1 hypothetical protein SNOG_14050 [Parastagonospora nodorum SN15]